MATEGFRMTKAELAYLLGIVWDTFQKKEAGKGLSTEDFTTILKSKLENLPSGAQANIIEAIKLAGNLLTPDANKAVDIPAMRGANASTNGAIGLVPAPQTTDRAKYLKGDGSWDEPDNTTYDVVTALVAGLMSPAMLEKLNGIAEGATANIGTITEIIMNGASKGTSGSVNLGTVLTSHQSISHLAPKASPELTGTPTAPTAAAGTDTTQIATTAFVAAAITAALSQITGVTFSFVQSLPQTGEAGTFYFVPNSGGSGTNNFDEYVWNASSSKFEKIGSPEVDLSGYMKTEDYPMITEAEIDQIVSGL